MIRMIETWGERLLGRLVPQATAHAGGTFRVCCNTTCTVTKVCWSCAGRICCSPCEHD